MLLLLLLLSLLVIAYALLCFIFFFFIIIAFQSNCRHRSLMFLIGPTLCALELLLAYTSQRITHHIYYIHAMLPCIRPHQFIAVSHIVFQSSSLLSMYFWSISTILSCFVLSTMHTQPTTTSRVQKSSSVPIIRR